MTTPDAIGTYDARAADMAERFEGVAAAAVHADLLEFLPQGQGGDLLALDVGAGSGRDAAWLASLGFEVVAVEPAAGLRGEGARRHPDLRIRWLDDRLPELGAVHATGLAFDLVLLSAVWMHIPPPARARAFRKLVTLLKSGGVLWLSLREGPDEPDRPMWPTPLGEIEGLARAHGLAVVRAVDSSDRLGRAEVRWTSVCLRLPDDGAGALPLLRGIIVNDEKSSTYKLGLLRAVARVADTASAVAVPHAERDAVDIPLGLVALNWVRMYLPLVAIGLPQMPGNAGPDGLGFAKMGFRALLADRVAGQDLRIGAGFAGSRAIAVWRALAEAASTIVRMPANFIRYPHADARVFEASPASPPRLGGRAGVEPVLVLDAESLGSFGRLSVPGPVWRTLQRLGSWVEPVLITEWTRLVRGYAERSGRPVEAGTVEARLAWLDPARDTGFARDAAHELLREGRTLTCVWSGASLARGVFDIDHCLPWSAWPCGDLWNLLPTSQRVNQHEKRDRLPSAAALANARGRIVGWWEAAWFDHPGRRGRFEREAAAALPAGLRATPDEVFAALEWRRLRLRQDQQLKEWAGFRARSTDLA